MLGAGLVGEQRRAHLRLREPGDPLGQRQVGEGSVGGVGEERVQRRLEAEEHPGGPARDLRDDPPTGGAVVGAGGEGVAPGVARVGRLGEGVGGGGAGALHQVDEPRTVAGAALVVGHELEHAVAGSADGVAEGEQLVRRRVGARDEPVLRAVQDRAARADAAGARPQAVLGQLRHLGDLVGARLALVGALAHHVGAQRGVRHLGGDVDGPRRLVERVEVLREALPVPVDALVERGAGDVLHALHQLDEEALGAGAHRREARRRSCP